MADYIYNKSDFTGAPSNIPAFLRLEQDIKNSAISTDLMSSPSRRANGRSCIWSSLVTASETVTITFEDTLSAGDKTILDGLISAHTAGVAQVQEFGLDGYVCGISTTWAGISDIQIHQGKCANHSTTELIVVPSSLTMDADTTGAGGLDTGSLVADTDYAVYAIGDSMGNNPVSVLVSTSFSAPTMPAGYDLRRQVGSFTTDGDADIRNFAQWGKANQRRYEYREPRSGSLRVLTGGSSSGSWEVLDVSDLIPASAIIAHLTTQSASSVQSYMRHKGHGDTDGSFLIGPNAKEVLDIGVIDQDVEWKTGSGGGSLTIDAIGYTEEI